MSLYDAINSAIDSGAKTWTSLWTEAQERWINLVGENPEKYRNDAEKFIDAMKESRTILDRMKLNLKTSQDVAKFNRLATQYEGLKERFMADAQQVGIAPLLVIAGIAMGTGAIAWAVAMYEYAAGLRDRVKLEEKELQERVAAAKGGYKLQESTLPPPPALPGASSYIWPGVVAIGLLGGLWWLGKGKTA